MNIKPTNDHKSNRGANGKNLKISTGVKRHA